MSYKARITTPWSAGHGLRWSKYVHSIQLNVKRVEQGRWAMNWCVHTDSYARVKQLDNFRLIAMCLSGRTLRLHPQSASQLFQGLALGLVDAFVLDVFGLGHRPVVVAHDSIELLLRASRRRRRSPARRLLHVYMPSAQWRLPSGRLSVVAIFQRLTIRLQICNFYETKSNRGSNNHELKIRNLLVFLSQILMQKLYFAKFGIKEVIILIN